MNIVLTGFMGTGKTVVGKRLAKRLGWAFVDIDKRIEAVAQLSVAAIFTRRGEAMFRRLERRQIRQAVRGDRQVIATGGGALSDPESRRCLRAAGTVVCLTARPHVILERVGRRIATRPLLNGGEKPLARIRTLLAKRAKHYAVADLTINTSNRSVEEVVEQLWQAFSSCVCNSWQFLTDHAKELSERYAGRYVAVVGERIIASGDTQLEAYRKIPSQRVGWEETGIYYISLPEESYTVL